jgi:uncharacterized protein (UPF0335 family)
MNLNKALMKVAEPDIKNAKRLCNRIYRLSVLLQECNEELLNIMRDYKSTGFYQHLDNVIWSAYESIREIERLEEETK